MSEITTWVEAIEKTKERFLQIAPTQMKFETEKGFAVQILKNNDFLMKAAQGNPVSLQQAITNVAAIGLSLNPAEKQAYLIPRTVKSGDKYVTKVLLEPSYMGMIKLATDSGSVKWVQAYVVYSNDEFMFTGAGEKPAHKFNPFQSEEKRGEFIGVYCVAKTADGDYLTNMMSAEQVHNIRDRSESWKSFQAGKVKSGGPWQTDFYQQAKKTVIRQAFNTWPRTNLYRLAAAVDISNENEGFEPILTSPNLGDVTIDSKEYFDSLIEKNDALGMYVFQVISNEKSDSSFTNLYHSFEKGQKGKYQRVIDDLINRGYNTVCDIRLGLVEALSRDDPSGVIELLDSLTKDEIDVIASGIEPALHYEVTKILGEQNN